MLCYYCQTKVVAMKKCPICEKGILKHVMEKHVLYGVDLGTYPGEKCTACGEVFTDSSVMKHIEIVAKEKGIWGLGRKTKIAKAGNSIVVRIPQKIAQYFKLIPGKEAYIHPEKDKIVVETLG